MEIKKPIFFLGSGRSGTTVLYNIIALHKDVCWFSNLSQRYARVPWLPMVNRMVHAPLVGNTLKQRIQKRITPSLRPSEGEMVYKHCGLEDGRKMTVDDLTPAMESRLKEVIANHIRMTGRQRFVNKRTANTQRITILHKLFPDAYYVHIIRDGRAVANSFYKVPWWREIDIWWLGDKAEKWEQMGREPIELCAVHWQQNVQEILSHRSLLGNRYLEIRYEDLVQDTPGTLSQILHFCQLSEYDGFFQFLPKLKNMNYKWDQSLTEQQKHVVEQSIGDFLVQLGYSL